MFTFKGYTTITRERGTERRERERERERERREKGGGVRKERAYICPDTMINS